MTKDATQVTQADYGERIAGRLCDWSLDGEKPVPLMQEAAAYIRTTTATLTAQVEALTVERDALRGALAEQVGECFDERCEMCLRHEALLTSTSEGE